VAAAKIRLFQRQPHEVFGAHWLMRTQNQPGRKRDGPQSLRRADPLPSFVVEEQRIRGAPGTSRSAVTAAVSAGGNCTPMPGGVSLCSLKTRIQRTSPVALTCAAVGKLIVSSIFEPTGFSLWVR